MYYESVDKVVKDVLIEEKINICDVFLNKILNFMSGICNYAEEDKKITPQLIIGNNVQNYTQTLVQKSTIIMYKDDLEGTNFDRIVKALALFCNNGWYIYVNIRDNELIEYGIFRMYTNIDGQDFEIYLKENSCDLNKDDDCGIIIIKVENKFNISLIRPVEDKINISFKLINDTLVEHNYEDLCFDIITKDECIIRNLSDEYPFLINTLNKILRNIHTKVHGTILLIVNETFEYPNKFLSGIKFDIPIDLYNHIEDNKIIVDYSSAEKFYAITGVFYEMLNNDGITIINDRGQILGYNAFYKGEIPQNIRGGARKRTALGIYENREFNCIKGIYFQSQDGESFYKRRKEYE